MRVTFDHVEPTAKNIYSFWFKPEAPMRYIAGQFTEIRLPHPDKDKRGDKRWFTLSSSPTDSMLSITTKLTADTGSSFKKRLKALKPGTELNLASPMGDFVLPKDPTIPLIFVAGGIGATPFHSIIKYLTDTGEKRDIKLIYAAQSEDEVAFRDTFEVLGDNFKTVTNVRITAKKILELAGNNPEQYIYLSGPEPMVEALEKDLKKLGINKKHIRTDFFPGYEAF